MPVNAAGTGSGDATTATDDATTLARGVTTPDSVLFTYRERVLQARLADGAFVAYRLCFLAGIFVVSFACEMKRTRKRSLESESLLPLDD